MDGLKIPSDIEDVLLPSVEVPIAVLSTFLVPPTQNPKVLLSPPSLSDLAPTAAIDHLIHQPTPPPSVVARLRESFLAAGGIARSIIVPRLGGHGEAARYAPWALSYWLQLDTVRLAKKEWGDAKQHLEMLSNQLSSKQTAESSLLLDRVYDVLQMLPWRISIQGFSISLQPHHLATYLSMKWLSDEHEDEMLSLLTRDVIEAGYRTSVVVENTRFMEKLKNVYVHREAYGQSTSDKWVRERGEELAQGVRKQLATIVHTDGNHWVAILIDFDKHVVRFGDSLGGKIRTELQKSIEWWTYHHTGIHFALESLPISRQSDGFSCGLLAWNALCSFLIPGCELIPITTRRVLDERLKVFLRVVERHYEQSFDADSLLDNQAVSERIDTEQTKHTEFDIQMSSVSSPISFPPSTSSPLPSAPSTPPASSPTALATSETSLPPSQSMTSPPQSSGKRKLRQRKSLSKSPEQKKRVRKAVTSTTRRALDGDIRSSSVLNFFKLTTATGRDDDRAREAERDATTKEITRLHNERKAERDAKLKTERATERKRKSRAGIKARDTVKAIAAGVLNSDGSKKAEIKELVLHGSPAPPELTFTTVAQHTRPARTIAEKAKANKKNKLGRKQTKIARPATYHNWLNPLSWNQIRLAALDAGWQMSPSAIVKALKRRDAYTFGGITRTSVREWIDYSGARPKWKESTLRRCGVTTGHTKGGQKGVLSRYPNVVKLIKTRLTGIRDASAPVSLVTARGLIVATILESNPEIFQKAFRDGSTFKASDSFVRGFLHDNLSWSRRKATRAAHKLPSNWEDLCTKSFFRKAYAIKHEDIPCELFVNSDQTQVVYAPGDKMTYAETGAKQVSLIGAEEKRAFTLMVSVASDGTLLPFQSIYVGKTHLSLPKKTSPFYTEAINAGFIFCPSGTTTYWSNQVMMREFVERVLVPYFRDTKDRLGLPESQRTLWSIDVWAVHRSEEFRLYMRRHHPTIVLDYVPAGCTGVDQPCDVGIQRPLKLSLKRSYHEDVVAMCLKQIEDGEAVIHIDSDIGALRDRSVGWLWKAFTTLTDKELVQKAFAGCKSHQWDLSYSSLTSFEARQALRDMKETDKEFWDQLTSQKVIVPAKNVKNLPEDDLEREDEDFEDDSDVAMPDMVGFMKRHRTAEKMLEIAVDGGLKSNALAEALEEPEEEQQDLSTESSKGQPIRRGTRTRQANTLYNAKFWQHNPDQPDDA